MCKMTIVETPALGTKKQELLWEQWSDYMNDRCGAVHLDVWFFPVGPIPIETI